MKTFERPQPAAARHFTLFAIVVDAVLMALCLAAWMTLFFVVLP